MRLITSTSRVAPTWTGAFPDFSVNSSSVDSISSGLRDVSARLYLGTSGIFPSLGNTKSPNLANCIAFILFRDRRAPVLSTAKDRWGFSAAIFALGIQAAFSVVTSGLQLQSNRRCVRSDGHDVS